MSEPTGGMDRNGDRGLPHERPLSPREGALLDFERDWRAHRGRKNDAIRERFGISAARYYQLLARLVDHAAAAEYDPLVVARLRRRRDRRIRERTARALGQRPDG